MEISFSPNEAIRTVSSSPFYVAGPQTTPHVEAQQLLTPGETREVDVLLSLGRHRVRAWGLMGGPSFLVADGGGGSGHAEARLRVTAMAGFRELFVSEVLSAGHFIGVGNLTVLFTDLRGSTELYRNIGDALAFAPVMKHFEVLTVAVAEADGAIVKTIGDAVMAVFRHPDDALRAVRDAQAELAQMDPPFVLKTGAHFGPCIAVNQNDRLDYFGSTSNIAARLGDLSAGDDMVISDDVYRDGAVEELLGEWGANASASDAQVRGIDEPLSVWRIEF